MLSLRESNKEFSIILLNDIISVSAKYSNTVNLMNFFSITIHHDFFVKIYIYTIFNTWLHFWLNIAFAINRINILFSAINWINIWFPLKSNMNFLLYFWNDIISVSSKYSQTVYLINWHFHYDFFIKIYKIRPHSFIAFVLYCNTVN